MVIAQPLFFLLPVLVAAAIPAQRPAAAACADSLHRAGAALYTAGKYDSAQTVLKSEIALREQNHDSLGLTRGLNALAQALLSGGKDSAALRAAERALTIARSSAGENDTLTARTYQTLAAAHDNLNDFARALDYLNRALAIRLKTGGRDQLAVAECYDALGHAGDLFDGRNTVFDNFNAALAIRLKLLGPDAPEIADSHVNLGVVAVNRGQFPKALDHFQRALAIYLKTRGTDHPVLATVYQDLGLTYDEMGNFGKAIEYTEKSLEVVLRTLGPDHPDLSGLYNNLGVFYNDLGDSPKAVENHKKALELQLRIFRPEHPDVAWTYDNIGTAYQDLKDFDRALEYHRKALALKVKLFGEAYPAVGYCYYSIGLVLKDKGDYRGALDNYLKALEINRATWGPEHPQTAGTSVDVGEAYSLLGDHRLAHDYFDKGLAALLATLGPDHIYVASTYWLIGQCYRREKKFDRSLEYLGKAIAIAEKVRSDFTAETMRKTFTESVRGFYDEIITLLIELGRPREAFEFLERSKSKLLQDELGREGIEIGAGELRLKLAEVKVLGREMSSLAQRVSEEKSKPAPERNKAKIAELGRLLARTKGEFFKLVADIKQNPDYAFTVTVDPVNFASIQRDLPEGNRLVMYYSSTDKLYILVVSRQGYSARAVDVPKDSLDRFVRRFRALLDQPDRPESGTAGARDLTAVVAVLYRWLIAPVQAEIDSSTEITFIPSGNLFYIPLGALGREQDGRFRYLVEDKPVSYLTSAELFRAVERKAKPETNPSDSPELLVVGNPTGAGLPGAGDEAKAIHALYPGSRLYLDGDAKKETVAEEASAFQILHLATHAFTNPKNPWDSYVYLVKGKEDDGHWTMTDVTNQTWDRMSLVTLSACETALGGDKPGMEMESLARAFSIAGSPSIIASLWPVSERSTRDLMVGFYTNLKSMSKVEALRRAQLALLANPAYAHPFYWAPFILIGDGR